MKKLIIMSVFSLFIFSCDDPYSPRDECGVSGGDNSTCIDECGILSGDNSCLDICGVPNGSGLDCGGSCNENVQLWGECYNIQTITTLDLSNSGLTGLIPSEICTISEDISIGNNQLCPPYPECIYQGDIDSQDTSNCP